MDIRKCPACHSMESTPYISIKGDQLHKCDVCTLVFSEFKNDDFEKMYNADYFCGSNSNLGYADYEGEKASHEIEFRHRLETIFSKTQVCNALLDVGCASGHFLQVASQKVKNIFGADISLDALSTAATESEGRYQVLQCDLERLCFKAKVFDVVTAYDVIEHLNRPKEAIQSIFSALKPGGMIHITVPNHGSLSRVLMKRLWYHYKPFEHLSYFNLRSLENLLKDSGFIGIEVRSYRTRFRFAHLLERVKFYSKPLYLILNWISKKLNLSDKVFSVPSGEIEAFAFKPGLYSLEPIVVESLDLMQVLCCPECRGSLEIKSKSVRCLECDSHFVQKKSVYSITANDNSEHGRERVQL